jgi:hypothetical protein
MDLQYAPALLTEDKVDATRCMLSTLSELAETAGVNLFSRFSLMRGAPRFERVSLDRMIGPNDGDRRHQSAWSAQWIGRELSDVIAAAAALAS